MPHDLASQSLIHRVDAVDEAARRLLNGTTPKDLAPKLREILLAQFPSSTVMFHHRLPAANEWNVFVSDGSPVHDPPAYPIGTTPFTFLIGESGKGIHAVQNLADGSSLGVSITTEQQSRPISEEDTLVLRTALQLFDGVVQRQVVLRNQKGLIFSMNHRVLQLTSLIDTGIEVSKLEHHASLEKLALERAASLTNASRGIVRRERDGKIQDEVTFPEGERWTVRVDEGIAATFAYRGDTFTFQLHGKESRTGDVPFEETDQLILDALVRQVQASLENHHLHRMALEKQKIEQELAVAASIQQRILPRTLPAIPGYDIAGVNIPSKSIGGDYYDCIPLSDGRFALIIADVAGKGVPAALLVSTLHAYLSVFLEEASALDQLARRLNRAIYAASPEDRFITAFVALLTPATGEVETVSAGHNPAYLLRLDGTVEELNTGGIALGMLDIDFPYQTDRVTLMPGERLLLYTDGVTEATNEKNELYDADVPLQQFVVRTRPERAEQFIQSLIGDIRRFSGDAPQSDDITALYLLRR